MKHPAPSDDDDFEVEITSLDELETPASNALLQGTHLAPRVRLWLTILSVVGGLLLLVVVLSPVMSSLLPKKARTQPTFHSPIQVENVTVQENIAYVSSSDGMWRALRMNDGSLLWQRNFPGGTPIFIKNTIYIYYYDQQFYTIQALRLSDGKPLWTFKTSSPGSIPVIIDDGVAYALSNSSFNRGPIQGQTLMALDAGTGRELWQYNINVPAPSNIGVQVVQDKIYINTVSPKGQTLKTTFLVLRSSDGLSLWHDNNSLLQQITPFNFLPAFSFPPTPNGLVYVTSSNGILKALSTENGHEVWHYTSALADAAEPPPTMGTHLFYMQTIEGSLKAIRADNGTLAWTYKDPWGITMIFSETNGVLYLKTGDGFIVALRASDGKRLWRVRPIAPPFTADMLWLEGNTAYTSTQVGNATVATLTALRLRDGKSLWQRKINMTNSMILPQVSDGQLLLVSGNTVTALRAQDGVVNWHADNVQANLQYGTPLDVEGNVTILHLSTGALEAHQLETGAVLWRYPR